MCSFCILPVERTRFVDFLLNTYARICVVVVHTMNDFIGLNVSIVMMMVKYRCEEMRLHDLVCVCVCDNDNNWVGRVNRLRVNHLGFCVTSFGLVSREALQRSDFVCVCVSKRHGRLLSFLPICFLFENEDREKEIPLFFFVTTERKKSKDGGESVTRKKGEEGGGKV